MNQDQVQHLIVGPGGVYVCDACVYRFAKQSFETQAAHQKRGCSFCGKYSTQVKAMMVSSSGVVICDECDNLCIEIIQEEQKSVARPRNAGTEIKQPKTDSSPDPPQTLHSTIWLLMGQNSAF